MSEHRKPPKPKHYDTIQKGQCRYCGTTILREDGSINKRSTWHPHCFKEYQIIYWPRETRKAVWKRDRGLCAQCGIKCHIKHWDLDHRQPLIEALGRIEFWQLGNLQTLCVECHKAKTGAEATARAQARKVLKEARPASEE